MNKFLLSFSFSGEQIISFFFSFPGEQKSRRRRIKKKEEPASIFINKPAGVRPSNTRNLAFVVFPRKPSNLLCYPGNPTFPRKPSSLLGFQAGVHASCKTSVGKKNFLKMPRSWENIFNGRGNFFFNHWWSKKFESGRQRFG